MPRWTLNDIPWERFDASRVDADILKIVKAASLVEYNGGEYARYLCEVFSDDPEFQLDARRWGEEENQHGEALARWASMADSSFDFSAAFAQFREKVRLPDDVAASVRGSRSGELIARCIVETGTSSYYTALSQASDEPVLKEVCRRIAADEFRHYKLFYDTAQRYFERENLSGLRRMLVALGRISESEDDDELPFAYYAANGAPEGYDRQRAARAYVRRAYGLYQPMHVNRGVGMILKAVGLKPGGRLHHWAARVIYRVIQARVHRLDRLAA